MCYNEVIRYTVYLKYLGMVNQMKVAIVGSRELFAEHLERFLPDDVTEIVSGGARGIDSCARNYALEHHLPLKEFLPEYEKYGRKAPLIRNISIIEYADLVLVFWDGKSRGSAFVIKQCRARKIPVRVFLSKK